MSKIEQYSRILHHRLTGEGSVFTVPTSNDHTDDTWSPTDLYIGEIGINVSDDKMFFRTNNGIIEVGVATASATGSNIWVFSNNNIEIGPSFAPDAITRNISSPVDLGTSTLRFSNLFLGNTPDGISTINVNNGFSITNNAGLMITSVNASNNIAAITIATQSSSADKTRPIHINTKNSQINGAGSERAIMASDASKIGSSSRTTIISGSGVELGNDADGVVYMGLSYSREWNKPDTVVVGGELAIRGVTDSNNLAYTDSEWIKGQKKIETDDALYNTIFTYPWGDARTIQLKAMVMAVATLDPSIAFTTEISISAYFDGTNAGLIGDPIIKEMNSTGEDLEVIADTNSSNLTIKVKGANGAALNWLCSYEYHVIKKISV